MEFFAPGSPVGITDETGQVKLFSESSQLSFVKIDVTKQSKGDFNMFKSNPLKQVINFGPLILLYYLSFSEIDSYFETYFEILSFNIQLIIIYFWSLKRPDIIGNGHVFLAGLINDVVMGIPLGLSPISYLIVSLVAAYIKNMTVNTRITTDWFTFFIAVFFQI